MKRILQRICFCSCIWFLGLAVSLRASDELRFNRIDVSDGLISNDITCFLRDSKGFLWIGSSSGLCRFDGYDFRRYKNESTDSLLIEEIVTDLAETADGKIWVTYQDELKSIFLPEQARFLPRQALLDSLGVARIPARLFTDREKRLYCTTYEGELYRYENGTSQRKSFTLDPDQGYVCALVDTGDRLYIIQNHGHLVGIDKATGKFLLQDDYLTRYRHAAPFCLYADSQGDLWVYLDPGHSEGLFHFKPSTGQWQHLTTESRPALSSQMVRALVEDTEGNLWIATDHGGLNLLDLHNGQMRYVRNVPFDASSLSQNSVISLYRDSTGILWAGTYKKGINYYHKSIHKFETYRYPLAQTTDESNNDFTALLADRTGRLWIGGSGNGLLRYDRESNQYVRHLLSESCQSPVSNVVISLAEDREGHIWVGSYMGGLSCFDGKQFTHYNYSPGTGKGLTSHSVYSLLVDDRNRLWIGTLDGGLNRLDLKTGEWHYYHAGKGSDGLSSEVIFSLATNLEGMLYVGTVEGVDCIDPLTGEVSHFRGTRDGKTPLRARIINTLFWDSRQLLWIGSKHGLHIYDQLHDRLYALDEEMGLPDNTILSIEEDAYHTMWVSTKNGLLRIEVSRGKEDYRFDWNRYDMHEGVQGAEFNVNSSTRLASGEMVFGGPNGLTFIDPDKVRYNTFAPSPFLTELMVNNEPVKIGVSYDGNVILQQDIAYTDQLDLRYEQRNLSFLVSSSSYFLPEKNLFSYKLEGFDQAWTTRLPNDRRITYTNLPAGRYTLLLKACNNDGVWCKEETRLAIHIHPPFWATGWAITIYIALGFCLLFGCVYLLLHRQRKRLEAEREQAIIRKQHELDELKFRFFTNVSHEFRTPLTLILTPLQRLLKEEKLTEERSLLLLIERNAKQLLRLVNQLLDFRKIDVQGDTLLLSDGDLVSFVQDITHSFDELATQKCIQFRFDAAIPSLPMRFDSDKVFKIISNLLSNAFKFTPEKGIIQVSLYRMEKENNTAEVMIEVTDNGIGIPKEQQAAVFDRFFQVNAGEMIQPMGTGIGLHLCREFVRMHQGRIELESEPGKGSCFRVILPILSPQGNEPAKVEPSTAKKLPVEELAETTQSTPYTLLIVDDNADFREFMRISLSPTYRVLTANDGEDAWKRLPEELPDMVISDVMMPIMDGLTLCRLIKTDIRTSHIPVILLTAKSAGDSQLSGLEAGADDYIAKPFNMEMLLLKVRHRIELQYKMQQCFLQRSSTGIALTEVEVGSLDEELMRKAIAYIEEQIDSPELSVERLSREMGMSRVNFYKKCLSISGKTPVELIRVVRLKRAAQLLEKSQLRVGEVAVACGFNDMKLFRKYFKEQFGLLPSDYPLRHHLN